MTFDSEPFAATGGATGEGDGAGCFQGSLLGQYLAILMMMHGVFGAAVWAVSYPVSPQTWLVVLAGAWVAVRAAGAFRGRWFSPLVTLGLLAAVGTAVLASASPAVFVLAAPPVFVAMLVITFVADLGDAGVAAPLAALVHRVGWPRLTFIILAVIFVGYMIVLPTGFWIYEQTHPPESGRVLEDLTYGEQVRIQCMKAMTAMIFFAIGAAVGSYLNVVAYRLPQGESVVSRSSRCPRCETEIRRQDNVPILGWMLLNGKCRACRAPISSRYPIVEVICAAIFLLFYFVELISGGVNIPVRQPNFHGGVVWIIFYQQWDVIRLYCYHCLAISTAFAFALMDHDRQRAPVSSVAIAVGLLLAPVVIWPELLPIPLFYAASVWLQPPWLQAAVTALVGGASGAVLGWLVAWAIDLGGAADRGRARVQLAVCLAVVGMSVGWQASIAVIAFALGMSIVLRLVFSRQSQQPPVGMGLLVLVAFVIHHALWRFVITHAADWWPSHRTTPIGWVVVATSLVMLVAFGRLLARSNAPPAANEPLAHVEGESLYFHPDAASSDVSLPTSEAPNSESRPGSW